MAAVTPYLQCEDAQAQASFYIEALGGEVVDKFGVHRMISSEAQGGT
ncbi:hypothetical protein [Paenibacillus sp.]|nr:hypothetical protein [Paenibacillus sp.]